MKKGDLFCCLPAVDGGVYPATAIARESSLIVGIPAENFSRLTTRNPAFSRFALANLSGCVRRVEALGGARGYESAEVRVVMVLLLMESKFGPVIPLTREEIAELSGLTVETTIRVVSRLKKERLVSPSPRGSVRINAPRLRAYLESPNTI